MGSAKSPDLTLVTLQMAQYHRASMLNICVAFVGSLDWLTRLGGKRRGWQTGVRKRKCAVLTLQEGIGDESPCGQDDQAIGDCGEGINQLI